MKKKERVLMNAIFALCRAEGQGVLTAVDILGKIPYKVDFREKDLEPNMDALSLDGYFSYDTADRKGETVYCIVLKERGIGYEREKKQFRKKVIIRIAVTIALAILSSLVKVVIDAIKG